MLKEIFRVSLNRGGCKQGMVPAIRIAAQRVSKWQTATGHDKAKERLIQNGIALFES